jgi:hypothetical protein
MTHPAHTRRLCRQFGNGSAAINGQLDDLTQEAGKICTKIVDECSGKLGIRSVQATKLKGHRKSG